MKREFRDKWVKALTDGSYQQGKSALKTPKGFCCLGVAADLIEPNGWSVSDSQRYPDWSNAEHGCGSQEVYGIADAVGITKRQAQNLAEKNDAGMPFVEIAAAISELPVED